MVGMRTELMRNASTSVAVMTELPVSSTACCAVMGTKFPSMMVMLCSGTTQCLQHSNRCDVNQFDVMFDGSCHSPHLQCGMPQAYVQAGCMMRPRTLPRQCVHNAREGQGEGNRARAQNKAWRGQGAARALEADDAHELEVALKARGVCAAK